MSRRYGEYGPSRCTCRATGPLCPECRDYKTRYLQPGGVRDDAAEDDTGFPPLAPCGGCGEVFAVRWAQRGALARGVAVYCGEACRKVQRRTRDQQLRQRRYGRG
jgi:hypothetical protein